MSAVDVDQATESDAMLGFLGLLFCLFCVRYIMNLWNTGLMNVLDKSDNVFNQN